MSISEIHDFEHHTNCSEEDLGYGPTKLYLYFLHGSVPVAVLIIIILAFLQKRTNKDRCKCLNGRPGIIIPWLTLDGYTDRWAFGAAFGATANVVIYLITQWKDFFKIEIPTWATVMFIYVFALEITISLYPLFACIATKHRFVGSICGLVYSFFWLLGSILTNFYLYMVCHYTTSVILVTLLSQTPVLLCLLYLVIMFGYYVVSMCVKGNCLMVEEKKTIAWDHQIRHVERLLKPEPEVKKSWIKEKLAQLYSTDSTFCYPSKMFVVFSVVLAMVYQLTIIAIYLGHILTKYITHLLGLIGVAVPDWIVIIEACYYMAVVFTACWEIGQVFLILRNYKSNMMKLYKGDRSFITLDISAYTPQNLMTRGMSYPGYQIAYMMWGYLISVVITFILLSIVIGLFYIPIKIDQLHIFLTYFELLVNTVVLAVVFFIQTLLVKFFFLQDKPGKDNPEKPLAVNNIRAYENASYYLFIANIFGSIFAYLWRIICSGFIGLTLAGRVDTCLFPTTYENMDKGHRAYIGMLLVEYSHNHPVLRVFCKMMMDNIGYRRKMSGTDRKNLGLNWSRGKKHWLVSLTLIHNPALVQQRKANILADRLKENESGDGDATDLNPLEAHQHALMMRRFQEGQSLRSVYNALDGAPEDNAERNKTRSRQHTETKQNGVELLAVSVRV